MWLYKNILYNIILAYVVTYGHKMGCKIHIDMLLVSLDVQKGHLSVLADVDQDTDQSIDGDKSWIKIATKWKPTYFI